MSLVSTYVYATDGKFYKNPVIKGEGWFICFDDDDPPELVVELSLYKKDGKEIFTKILQEQQLDFKIIQNTVNFGGSRYFSDTTKDKYMKPACRMFFMLKGPISPPPGMTGIDLPPGDCCIEGISMKEHEKLRKERRSSAK